MTGLFTFVAIFTGITFLTNKNIEIQRLKRDKPFLNLAVILIIAGFLFNLLGSLLMFMSSICLPLGCKNFNLL